MASLGVLPDAAADRRSGAVLIFTDLLPLSGAETGASVAAGGLTVLVTMAYSVRELRHAKKAEENEGAE